MSEDIVEGRDEVGLSIFLRGGAGLWVGSELDIGEARALFDRRLDRWVNATIN
jgi:homospermidine synthase